MEPGTHLRAEHGQEFREFLDSLAVLTDARLYSRLEHQTRCISLEFPPDWRGLKIEIKWPANSLYLDLDLTVRSAVTDPTILATKDEAIAKMFLTSIIQLYDPTPWGPALPNPAES